MGDRGVIMATTDGGAHWVKQKSGTTRILSGVAFADAKHGWAVGGMNNGETDTRTQLVLSTSDGGTHWAGETLGRRGGYLLAVACSDPSHVWVGGTYGNGTGAEILASTDGGVTWTTQYRDHLADDLISAIVFADASHGWALTEYGQVLATSDGGAHWAAQRIPGPRPLMWVQLACSDADHCWIAGLGAKNPALLLATADGGATWRTVATPKALSAIQAVWAPDTDRVVLGGANLSGKAFSPARTAARAGAAAPARCRTISWLLPGASRRPCGPSATT